MTVFRNFGQNACLGTVKISLSGVLGRKLHRSFIQLQKLEKWLPEADNYLQLQAREFSKDFWNF